MGWVAVGAVWLTGVVVVCRYNAKRRHWRKTRIGI